jgi:hypothetical protein
MELGMVALKEMRLVLEDDLYKYLSLLEKLKFIKSKEEAVVAAIRIFKKLNMQDWLPYVYRVGSERVLIMGQGILYDIFSSMSENELYNIARSSAFKRKILVPFDPELDLTKVENWDVILNDIQDFGWGKVSRDGEEIMVEYLGVPLVFLKGYLEALFRVSFRIHTTKMNEVLVLSKDQDQDEIWL